MARHTRRSRRPKLSKKQQEVNQLAANQDWKCCYCGCQMQLKTLRSSRKRNSATLEHIVLRTEGGQNVRSNMMAACNQCNGLRGQAEYIAFKLVMNVVRQIPQIMNNWYTSSDHEFKVIRHEILTRIRLVQCILNGGETPVYDRDGELCYVETQSEIEHELNGQIRIRQETFNPGR